MPDDWLTIRSRRDPAYWLPILLVIGILVPLALLLFHWMDDAQIELERLLESDPQQARERIMHFLRYAIYSAITLLLLFCVLMWRFFQLARRQQRLPPEGWWSLGAYRARVGESARRLALVGMWLAAILAGLGVGLVLLIEQLVIVMFSGSR